MLVISLCMRKSFFKPRQFGREDASAGTCWIDARQHTARHKTADFGITAEEANDAPLSTKRGRLSAAKHHIVAVHHLGAAFDAEDQRDVAR